MMDKKQYYFLVEALLQLLRQLPESAFGACYDNDLRTLCLWVTHPGGSREDAHVKLSGAPPRLQFNFFPPTLHPTTFQHICHETRLKLRDQEVPTPAISWAVPAGQA